ncbi:hypothetical protein [Stenoxybacter acetivorans]|uniref:hypothetical protein n=1 Tax=Stenoxybacter acetivorans TaxID=422441 RepID=UPI0005644965|nr:hypothetical protein [Stenoxybacter acetivorans]
MSNIDEVCKQIYNEVPHAIGVAVVDTDSAMILGVYHEVPHFDQEYLDAVAGAAVNMVRGRNTYAVEDMIAERRGKTVQRNSVTEMQMNIGSTFHFMAAVPGKPYAYAFLITEQKANLGLGWRAIRNALPAIAGCCL